MFRGFFVCLFKTRDGILGHQFNKSLESFAPCYSRSLLLADFKEIRTLLKNPCQKNRKTRKLESIRDLCFVEQKNDSRKNKYSSPSILEFMPTTSTKNVIQEFHLYIFSLYGETKCLESLLVSNYFMHPNKLKLILSLVQGGGVVLGGGGYPFHKRNAHRYGALISQLRVAKHTLLLNLVSVQCVEN